MKLLSLWAEATVKQSFVLLATIAILMIGTSDVFAFGDYSGCEGCHGSFLTNPYDPPSGDTNWSDSLHTIHRSDMLGFDCDTCHGAEDLPVNIDSSDGGNGLAAISCVGCHGRDEDMGNDGSTSPGRGAGLRQYHTRAGQSSCTNCHADAILASYTPVGEDILPNYYANPGTGHANMPTDPCNPSGGENFAGSATGMDNDGNGSFDGADSACLIPVELMNFEIE